MSGARKHISTRTRFEIFKRDGFTCQYCGATPPDVVLHVDHILAVANGGDNDPTNLATSCSKCNMGKSAVPLESVPRSLEDQAAEALERSQQMKAYADLIRGNREAERDALWVIAEVLQSGASEGYSRDKCGGISLFITKIGFGVTLESAYVAVDKYGEGNQRFKYFCGVCWNRVRELEA
jgi:hypothetical protein